MLIYIKDAEYLEGYKINVEFTNGESKIIDLENHLNGEVFEPLKDINVFKTFYVNKDTETIEWSNGADLAPMFLYSI